MQLRDLFEAKLNLDRLAALFANYAPVKLQDRVSITANGETLVIIPMGAKIKVKQRVGDDEVVLHSSTTPADLLKKL